MAEHTSTNEPPPRVARYVDETTPENQAETFRNQDQVWPVRAIRRGGRVRPLPPHARQLEDLSFKTGGVRLTVADFMAGHRTAGLLVLKHGEIALERYGLGNTPQSRWISFSTAKSMTATLAGAALHDGAITSLDDPCERYLPRLAGSAYEGVTIRNVLRMCSGVAWREDPDADGRSEVHRLGRAMVRAEPGGILELMCKLPRAHPQGTVFNYNTGESCVLAAVVVAATGRPLADYFGDRIWGPAGMEADAHWQLESEGGLEIGGLGVSARLRDVARLGQFVLEDGVTWRGARVLPPGWRDLAGKPDCPATAFGRLRPDDPSGYGYQWWVTPPAPGIHNGVFAALGAYGQFIYINAAEQVVVAIHSAWRQNSDDAARADTVALIRAAVGALRADAAP
jgi:CubicO group peptidase (beta-lactamase class C family)